MDKSIFLVEAKADRDRFINWYVDSTISEEEKEGITDSNREEIKSYAEAIADEFISLKSRIKSPYNDFYYWIKNSSAIELDKYLSELRNEVSKKQNLKQKEQEGAELIYSNDTWKVYHITNYEASAKYGKGTKWCITGTERWNDGNSGEETFKNYHDKNGLDFYFFIKNGNEKYALAMYPDRKHYEIYNVEDVKIAYIEDAPKVEGLPDVSTKEDWKILINAIMSGKIDEQTILDCMEIVLLEQAGLNSFITKNKEAFASSVEEFIPDGYLEHEAVASGDMTPEEYESITGENYEEDWTGDYHWFAFGELENLPGTTKKEKCDVRNFAEHKYWILSMGDNGYEIYNADDYVGLYMLMNGLLDTQSWSDDDVANYFDDEEGSRVDIVASMIADTLINEIQQGRISKSVISNIGLSDEYLAGLRESFIHLTESLENDYDALVKMSIDNMNKFLDEFGFEVQLVDYDFDSDALGMFVNSVQDNASVFPIALNKELIIKKSDEYQVDLDTAILTTIAHEVGHGLFEYLEDLYDLEEADEEEMVEEFARDYYDNNLSNNALYRLLLDYGIEDGDNVVEESLLEMRGKGNISDEKILRYVDECIKELKKINFGDIDTDCLTYDDIDIEEGNAMGTFGTMFLPRNGQGNFKLVLNKYMFDESEEAIKNTIYHELCHYITDKLAIDCGAFYTKNGKWYVSNDIWNAKDYKGHGRMWKHIANVVGNAVGHDITRTNTFDLHTGVGKHYDETVKYIVKCKHCGYEFKYNRMTNFIKEVLRGNGHTHNYYCNCDDGTKGYDFEIIKCN